MVYGGGSIKKNGLYDSIVKIAKDSGIELFELSGVEPNPRHSTVNKGAAICKEENIDVVLAAAAVPRLTVQRNCGGCPHQNGDVWPLVSGGVWVTKALPVIAILTNAGNRLGNGRLGGYFEYGNKRKNWSWRQCAYSESCF